MTDEQIKPCPFCGSSADMDENQFYRNITTGEPETALAIFCTGCCVQISIPYRDVPDIQPEQVIDMWNRRQAASAAPDSKCSHCEHCQQPSDCPYQAAPQQEPGQARELPPLPRARMLCGKALDSLQVFYTAEQMREYARAAQPAPAVPEIVREAVEAAFEDKPGWRTKIAAAVRAIDAAPAAPEQEGGK